MKLRESLAKNVQRMRKEAHLSQEELGHRIGFSRSQISGIERQDSNLTLDNVEKLAAGLEVEPEALFFPEGMGPGIPVDAFATRGKGSPARYVLVEWTDDEYLYYPIEVRHGAVAAIVLTALLAKGYDGPELLERYAKVEWLFDYLLFEPNGTEANLERIARERDRRQARARQ